MATAVDRVRAAGRDFLRATSADRAGSFPALLRSACEREWAERRFFLWLPVCAGSGVFLYFAADREPSLPYVLLVATALILAAGLARHRRRALVVLAAVAAIATGFAVATLRTALVSHPVLDRVRIVKLNGRAEEVDHRRTGARFVLRVTSVADPALAGRLTRVRLTTRRAEPLEAGDALAVTARLVPPAGPVLPGGFDFSKDAYYQGFDAVGSVLGRIRPDPDATAPGLRFRLIAAVDRARNALAARVSSVLEGDTGAIAAAMVTGKRDLLSDDGRELIREAGIFHIITIAGVQMTLVAGLLFGAFRAGLAAWPDVALRYPVKAWAAAGAIVGACAYDTLTGSRIGTQRALLMTTVMLGAVLFERRAFTMRNLALAALAVILIEPETVMGASFQLSFAAVAALVAVQEARLFEPSERVGALRGRWPDVLVAAGEGAARLSRRVGRLLGATVAATTCTAPVMAGNFHEISPYVLIGNPLTLGVIEIFAVPGALLGSVLYPLGLDRFVWTWVGWGIAVVLWVARLIAAAPGATLNVPEFAIWSLPCFALATCSAVLWRSPILKLIAVPLAVAGLVGTMGGPRYDLLVAPGGDTVAFRTAGGRLGLAGKANAFAAEQWLRAEGDGRTAAMALQDSTADRRCDTLACVARLGDGRTASLVLHPEAFEDDCRRADVIVTPLDAPESCAAEVIVDRGWLAASGALAFVRRHDALLPVPARTPGVHRPWMPVAPIPTRPWRPTGTPAAAPSQPDESGPPESAPDTDR